MDTGYIKLWRKLTKSFFYKNSKYVHLWVHILFEANHADKEFLFNGKRMICKRGQFVTGRTQLAFDTGIHRSSIERLLESMENEHLISQEKNNKFRLITVLNYEEHQRNDFNDVEQPASNKRATNEHLASTTNNDKKLKNDKNIESCASAPRTQRFQKPTTAQVLEYAKSISFDLDAGRFCDYYESKGWIVGKSPMKDWKAAVRTWKTQQTQSQPLQAVQTPKKPIDTKVTCEACGWGGSVQILPTVAPCTIQCPGCGVKGGLVK